MSKFYTYYLNCQYMFKRKMLLAICLVYGILHHPLLGIIGVTVGELQTGTCM